MFTSSLMTDIWVLPILWLLLCVCVNIAVNTCVCDLKRTCMTSSLGYMKAWHHYTNDTIIPQSAFRRAVRLCSIFLSFQLYRKSHFTTSLPTLPIICPFFYFITFVIYCQSKEFVSPSQKLVSHTSNTTQAVSSATLTVESLLDFQCLKGGKGRKGKGKVLGTNKKIHDDFGRDWDVSLLWSAAAGFQEGWAQHDVGKPFRPPSAQSLD